MGYSLHSVLSVSINSVRFFTLESIRRAVVEEQNSSWHIISFPYQSAHLCVCVSQGAKNHTDKEPKREPELLKKREEGGVESINKHNKSDFLPIFTFFISQVFHHLNNFQTSVQARIK